MGIEWDAATRRVGLTLQSMGPPRLVVMTLTGCVGVAPPRMGPRLMTQSDERQPSRHPRDLIRSALALMEEGGPQIRDGGSDSGPPLYDSADQGWTLAMECSWTPPMGQSGARLLAYRFYVDNVGI